MLRFDVAVRAEAETLVLRLAPETTLSAPVRPARYPATAPRGENAISHICVFYARKKFCRAARPAELKTPMRVWY